MNTALSRVVATDYAALDALSKTLVPTGFLPDTIKTPGQALAIILAGREMGVGPMQALRSINLVKGKVTVAADLQLALFKNAGGKATFSELTEAKAVLDLVHPNGDKHREIFSMQDAEKAGLLANQPNYRKFPKAMLRSRAITAGLKSIGFEVCAGAYDPEELDIPATEARPVTSDGEVVEAEVVVESTPASPADFLMPFGKTKGTRLGDMKASDLKGALTWAQEKGKFEEFQAAAAMVLAGPASFAEKPTALEGDDGWETLIGRNA